MQRKILTPAEMAATGPKGPRTLWVASFFVGNQYFSGQSSRSEREAISEAELNARMATGPRSEMSVTRQDFS